jgi:nucleotidyltransferase/DNA polymerase involved in DNA repair
MQALQDLEKIWGVGPAAAVKLYNSGFISIAKLRKDNSPLTSL